MDVLAYLRRINYNGPIAPTAATLRNIHLAHLQSVPFENLDIHLGRPIILKLENLFEKIVLRGRGGFCYELNGLFAWLLGELGFEVTLLSASDAQEDGSYGPEFDHLTLQIRCPADPSLASTPWLADVGWGDSFREPLRLDQLGHEQLAGLRAYRIERDGDYLMLWQRNYDGRWRKQYRFTLASRRIADFVPMCQYHQTSPESHFTQQRICTLATLNGRISLDDRKLIVTEFGNRKVRSVSQEEYHAILEVQFGVKLVN
jgi:N-hydroxyarylamine O-acetyltransferase